MIHADNCKVRMPACDQGMYCFKLMHAVLLTSELNWNVPKMK